MPTEYPLTKVREFFEYATLKEFRADWMALSDESKAQIREGLANGSLSY